MNELVITKAHGLIISILDGIDNGLLPAELKTRNRADPGRVRKMLYEKKLARLIYRRFKRQREKIALWFTMRYPEHSKAALPDDWFEDAELDAELHRLFAAIYLHGINLFEDSTLFSLDYSVFHEKALAWSHKNALELIKNIDETTRKTIGAAISSFVETPGMTVGDVVNLLPFDPERSMRIAVTEITRTYGQANLEAGQEMKKEYPDVRVTKRWFTDNDDRVCEICGPLHGVEVEIDEYFPGGYDAPPAHVNCILPGNIIDPLGNIFAVTKSLYNGGCIEISVSNGSRITVTENHPILTNRGWVLAKNINVFDNVISTIDSQRITSSINPNNNHRPTMIEEIFASTKKSLFMTSISVPTSPEHFHGDGKSINGNIEIIYTDSFLICNANAALFQPVGQLQFIPSNDMGALQSFGMQNFSRFGDNRSASRYMGICQHRNSLGFGSIFPTNNQRFRNSPRFYSGINNMPSNNIAPKSKLLSQFIFMFSGNITSENVIKVRKFDFNGHVYNLQSEPYNLYSVNGIITHNCRCAHFTRTRI